ncbi:MAG: homoserine kinase [Ilumatobacteraceae bacterium]
MIVRVPGSSANLGPGFDTLGMALTVHLEVGAGEPPAEGRPIDEHHPATIAHRAAGGSGPLWEHCAIPVGRGLGFSGAARVGGALLARAQQAGGEPGEVARADVLTLVSELEGHADNVAASLYGGVVATAAGRVARVPVAVDAAVVVWIPSAVTKTDESRRSLGAPVPFDDVVFNLGRVALLVAALASGDTDALRTAVEDRVHQPLRLDRVPASRAAIEAAYGAGAWAAWLSGSGPTVAALCPPAAAPAVAAALPAGGHAKVLAIDLPGAQIGPPYTS